VVEAATYIRFSSLGIPDERQSEPASEKSPVWSVGFRTGLLHARSRTAKPCPVRTWRSAPCFAL